MNIVLTAAALAAMASLAAVPVQAADWSDTSLTYHYGTKFAEPFEGNDVTKNIVSVTHADGYKYGTNFFNVDMLMSDKNDPSAPGSKDGAQETYIVYRNTVDLGKVAGSSFKYGFMRGFGITGGFDYNAKTDSGYNSKKRMLVLGPTFMMDVPGFWNISVLMLNESNAPHSDFTGVSTSRYTYKLHPELDMSWSVPLGNGFAFEGFADFIASKGKNEFGANTAAETLIDMQVMYDLSGAINGSKNTFKVGFEYQYWKNKFGNSADGPAGSGAFAKTPMLRAEYHF